MRPRRVSRRVLGCVAVARPSVGVGLDVSVRWEAVYGLGLVEMRVAEEWRCESVSLSSWQHTYSWQAVREPGAMTESCDVQRTLQLPA